MRADSGRYVSIFEAPEERLPGTGWSGATFSKLSAGDNTRADRNGSSFEAPKYVSQGRK